MPQPPVRNATIHMVPPGAPAWRPENFLLLDPEQPTTDPNELLKLRRGRMADPNTVNHNCPCCDRTMSWSLFKAHALACYKSWRKIKVDVTRRKFAGASLEDAG